MNDRSNGKNRQRSGWPGVWRPAWSALVSPPTGFERIGDRRRSELLAGLLLTLLCLGLLSGLVQLAAVPGFLPTFVSMVVALVFVGGAYALSRTPAYRGAAVIASLVPTIACLAVVVQNPNDQVALPFMVLSVVFATAFLSTGWACAIAVFVLAVVGLATVLLPPLRAPERCIPAVAFHGIMSTLLLLAARQRNRLELEQDRRLQEADVRLARADFRERELEARISSEHRFASVGRLSVGVGHDLNNLLSVILSAHLGIETKAEGVAVAIRQAEAAGAMATSLVSHMLALARSGGEISEPKVVDLNAVIREGSDLLPCAAGNCRLVIEYEEEPVPVRCDPLDLQRILLNLASNAGNAMPDGGTLRIEVFGPQRLPALPAGGLPHDRHTAITISDTGSGMDRGTIARAFEPFVSTRAGEGGQGLGLAIVTELVRRHGGQLDVWSEPGRGTRFTLFLPIVS